MKDGPASGLFSPLTLRGNASLAELPKAGVSKAMADHLDRAPSGACVAWGIPLRIGRVVLVKNKVVSVKLPAVRARWLVFAHTSDVRPLEWNEHGFVPSSRRSAAGTSSACSNGHGARIPWPPSPTPSRIRCRTDRRT
ncbi:MAG: hypothetical protein AMJ81_10560 [Phycisphaerae bacterium SM23_33]|nr:MAG: hypothetical protein AMJ81_10560 [Phycisphaerae bacterium SM23_33]